jgi:hypothetical protein
MDPNANRRQALMSLSLGAAGLAGLGANSASAKASAPNLIPPGASALSALSARLATAPRRRDFKTLPMFVTADEQWDKAAFDAVLAYRGGPKQVWHNRELNGGWLYLMDNAISAQVFSFKHLDFLAVSATHGTAGLALFDETAWDKYQFGKLTKSRAVANTWIADKGDGGDPKDVQKADGAYSGDAMSIPHLMRRGAVFLVCHHAIWEGAATLHKSGPNPDKLSLEQLAADLTNHVLPGAIVTPGIVASIPELQMAGYNYIDS